MNAGFGDQLPVQQEPQQQQPRTDTSIALCGQSALLPAGIDSLSALSIAAAVAHDAISQVPAARWDVSSSTGTSRLEAVQVAHNMAALCGHVDSLTMLHSCVSCRDRYDGSAAATAS